MAYDNKEWRDKDNHEMKVLTPGSTSLLYGKGCYKHDDCFTCPLPDCTWYPALGIKENEDVSKCRGQARVS